MRLAKLLSKVLLGRTGEWNKDSFDKYRTQTITFPGVDGEPDRKITYRTDDGLILYFVKKIEALEKTITAGTSGRKH